MKWGMKGCGWQVVADFLAASEKGLIKVARHLLDLWADVADKKIAQPCWCCSDRQTECYPHDALLRFQTHNVSWPLARVVSRLAVQIPSFEEAGDNLAEDYHVHLAQETVRKSPRQRGQRFCNRGTNSGV